jgi:hypothetical protein
MIDAAVYILPVSSLGSFLLSLFLSDLKTGAITPTPTMNAAGAALINTDTPGLLGRDSPNSTLLKMTMVHETNNLQNDDSNTTTTTNNNNNNAAAADMDRAYYCVTANGIDMKRTVAGSDEDDDELGGQEADIIREKTAHDSLGN